MSDHGYRFLLSEKGDYEEGNKCFYSLKISEAYMEDIWQGIKPIDTFRLIFNKYFGANYPYLSKPAEAVGTNGVVQTMGKSSDQGMKN